MIDITNISSQPISEYFDYIYTLTEKGRAILPPHIKPMGEEEHSREFWGWDLLPYLYFCPEIAQYIESCQSMPSYITYYDMEEGDVVEEEIPPFTWTDGISEIYDNVFPFPYASLKLGERKSAWVSVLLKKMQEWGLLNDSFCFTERNPLTGRKWRDYEKGMIMETLCHKIGMTQTEWKKMRGMLIGKNERDWKAEDDRKLKSIEANVRQYRVKGPKKTYELLDPKKQAALIELCQRIDKFDTSAGQRYS